METMRTLLREYAAYLNASLGGEHICLAKYEQELAGLPEPYVVLLFALVSRDEGAEEVAGCVLLKPIPGGCEMKRLWVRPQFQCMGIGRKLIQALLDEAKRQGYAAMYLDTVPDVMRSAHRLYQQLGFERVERYNDNPVPDVEFFRRTL